MSDLLMCAISYVKLKTNMKFAADLFLLRTNLIIFFLSMKIPDYKRSKRRMKKI